MPFGLKIAPSEFQRILNEIFNPYSKFAIVYINDVLILSQSIDQHFKHINIFVGIIKRNDLTVSKTKIDLFQTKIRFLGHMFHQGTITLIKRSIEFADKFQIKLLTKINYRGFWDA